MHHCWIFEAGSIQAYLFDTGRLRDAVGASLLVDRLTGDLDEAGDGRPPGAADDLLSSVLMAVGAEVDGGDAPAAGAHGHARGRVRFARRGGGSFIAFFDDTALRARARALWQAALDANAPGLRWSDGVGDDDEADRALDRAMGDARAGALREPPRWPQGHAAALRVARTGQPACARARLGADVVEAVDDATLARRRHARAESGRRLEARFNGDPSLRWPRTMESDGVGNEAPTVRGRDRGPTVFPFVAGRPRRVAFLHADGNGLGVLVRRVGERRGGRAAIDPIAAKAAFSRAIASAATAASQQATRDVLIAAVDPHDRIVPARPLVLGGDDLTIIVREDLAVRFAEAFLIAFEAQSSRALAELRRDGVLEGSVERLTAACGIAVVSASYPFAMAAELAEDLCRRVKEATKADARRRDVAMPVSAIGLRRVTASLAEAAPSVVVHGRSVALGMPAYTVGAGAAAAGEPAGASASALPTLAQLRELVAAIGEDAGPRGPLRRLAARLHQSAALAEDDHRRWQALMSGTQRARVRAALMALGVAADATLPIAGDATPLADALLLRDLETPMAPESAPAGPPAQVQR